LGYHFPTLSGGRSMWLEDHFGSGSMLQRNERVKLAASFWNNIGAGLVIGGMAAAFFLDKPQGSPGSRKPSLPVQLDVTLGRFNIGRARAAIRRPMSNPRSTASNRRLIDMA
jgi:hypothetical protein